MSSLSLALGSRGLTDVEIDGLIWEFAFGFRGDVAKLLKPRKRKVRSDVGKPKKRKKGVQYGGVAEGAKESGRTSGREVCRCQ